MTDFTQYERSIYSQGGEDGVLEKLFEIIEPGPKFAVEIGSSDGIEGSNTRNLSVSHGWRTLLLDGERGSRAGTQVVLAWVSPINVEALLGEHDVPKDLDLLSIDIDGNDYYVWEAVRTYRPKVVVIEYNAGFPPPQRAVVEFDLLRRWDHTDYFGASLQVLCDLGKSMSYELVHCESLGANAFFVESSYYPLMGMSDNSPQSLYRLPQYGVEHGGRASNGRGYPMCLDRAWCVPELIMG